MDPGGGVDVPVVLVIKAPNQRYTDQRIHCFQNWTVEKLKAHLSDVYPSKPSSKDQRLVYSGKLLLDHFTLKDVLRVQDEYHMLHLVCASRTPPPSPSPSPRARGNKAPLGPAAAAATPAPTGGDGVRHRTHGPYYPVHPAFMHGLPWNQYPPQPVPPTSPTESPTYNPMTLMWWQQQYFRQYYAHYQAWAAWAQQQQQQHWQDLPPAAWPSTDLSQPPRDYRHGNNNNNHHHNHNHNVAEGAQAAAVAAAAGLADAPNEEEEHRDWLDWVYTMLRTAVLISIVYFYSSFSRFVLVMGAILVLNLHQAGWFPFNLENEGQAGADGAPPEENAEEEEEEEEEDEEEEDQAQPQEREVIDDTLDDDDDDDDAEEDDGGGGGVVVMMMMMMAAAAVLAAVRRRKREEQRTPTLSPRPTSCPPPGRSSSRSSCRSSRRAHRTRRTEDPSPPAPPQHGPPPTHTHTQHTTQAKQEAVGPPQRPGEPHPVFSPLNCAQVTYSQPTPETNQLSSTRTSDESHDCATAKLRHRDKASEEKKHCFETARSVSCLSVCDIVDYIWSCSFYVRTETSPLSLSFGHRSFLLHKQNRYCLCMVCYAIFVVLLLLAT
ncbi:hypothetical protein CRUP_024337 [Coryphaenoides rupestris]|nr:hypothetical protein CRUP_024337 [Coryphaenoides rupestris]